jgi:hypothetical protein
MSIVVNHCREPLDWLPELQSIPHVLHGKISFKIYLYEKCDHRTNEQISSEEREWFESYNIERRLIINVGFEAYTYIYHIMQHYNHLPAYTFFFQCDVMTISSTLSAFTVLSDDLITGKRNGFVYLAMKYGGFDQLGCPDTCG